MLASEETAGRVEIAETTAGIVIQNSASYLLWGAIIAGALVATAVSLVLMAFGSPIGLAVLSFSPTWRDASPALTVASGIYLLLTAPVSFGLGGYVAGRLRERWDPTASADVVEFRDGTYGILTWAIAVVVIGVVIAASAAGLASKTVEPATSPAATAGESLIVYELDRLFRAERHPPEAQLTYVRAEAGRILLAAAGRQGITPDDRSYLVRLAASETGAAPADAERRVDIAITTAATAIHKARRNAVILGFSTAASLLFGAAAGMRGRSPSGHHRPAIGLAVVAIVDWRF